MAEVPPIQKTVDPKLSMTSADQALALEKAFDETFGPIGETPQVEPKPKDSPAPVEAPEPEEEPTVETLEPEEERVAVEGGSDEPLPASHPDDEPDEEVDKFKLHPETRPESLSIFRDLRGMLKTEKKKARELAAQLQKQESERTPRAVSDPAVQKEIEELRTFWQRHQIFDDTTYQTLYETPVHNKFNEIIADIKAISDDEKAAKDWEGQMRSVGPDRLDKRYWNEDVINRIADPLDRDRVLRKVSELITLQENRNTFRKQIQEQPDAYQKFQHEQAAQYWDNFGKEAQDEMQKVTPTLGQWAAPRDLKSAKNATEKAAIEAHNKVYGEYEELFKQYITDAATQGPRGMARVSAQAVYAEKRRRDLEVANKKIAKLTAERDNAQEELNKIAGARSRVAQPSSAGPNGAPAPKPKGKASQSVDDAFKNFFGS